MKPILTLLEAPTEFPISLSELKAHLHYTGTDHDDRLEDLIEKATNMLERMCDRSFTPTTWRLDLDCWQDVIYLPKPPLMEVTSVSYYDEDNNLTVVDDSNYFVSTPYLAPAMLVFNYQYVRPTHYSRPYPIQIEFI